MWTTVFTFTPEGDGATRVDLAMTKKSLTLGARLMSPMMLLFARPLRKAMEQDLADLKRACEAPTDAGAPAALTA